VFKSRLKTAGVNTADDIAYGRVQSIEGIGPQRASALVAWKQDIDSRARRSMSQSLSQVEISIVQAKHQSIRRAMEDQRNREQQTKKDREVEIRMRYAAEVEQVDAEMRASEGKTQAVKTAIRERYAPQYRRFQEITLKLEADAADDLQKVDDEVSEVRKKLFSLHWELGKEKGRVKSFEEVRLPKYFRRVFLDLREAW
jgi:hypothetical protein